MPQRRSLATGRIGIGLKLVWFVLLGLSPLWGQDYLYRHYQLGHELPNQSVNSIVQDQEGRIWVATRGGISVYNGVEWRTLERPELKAPPNVHMAFERLLLGQDGSLWAIDNIHLGLINLYHHGSQGWSHHPNEMGQNQSTFETWLDGVVGMSQEGQSYLALISSGGMLLTHQLGRGWKTIGINSTEPPALLTGITPYHNSLLISSSSGLLRYDDETLYFASEFNHQLPDQDLMGVSWDNPDQGGDGGLWILGKEWICHLNNGIKQLFPVERVAPDVRHTTLYADRSGGLFILSHDQSQSHHAQLTHFSPFSKRVEHFDSHISLKGKLIQSMALDWENTLWLGTSRGISKLVNRNIKSLRRENGLMEDEVSAIHFISPQNLIIGHNEGYTRLQGAQFIPHPFARSPFNQRVLSITHKPDTTTYLACSNKGLLVITPQGEERLFHPSDMSEQTVNGVCYDPIRAKIWVACSQGIYTFENERFQRVKDYSLDKVSHYRSVQLLPNGTLGFCTITNGLITFDGEKWQRHASQTNQLANNVYHSLIHPDYGLLLATSAGLFRASDNMVLPQWLGTTLITEICYSLLLDLDQRLWIGTQYGLLSWDGHQLRRLRTGDGMKGYEVNRNALKLASDGQIWVGSTDGISIFQPSDPSGVQPTPPRVHLTELRINEHAFPLDQPQLFDYEQNSFSIHFYCPSYINEFENRFRYRLKGYDPIWKESLNHNFSQITYQNLPPGEYQFEILAANAYGAWGGINRSASIRISHPFWLNPIFLVTTGLFILLIPIWGVVILTQKRHAKVLIKEVEFRTEQLQNQTRQLEQLNSELRQANSQKNKFFSIIAHDLRNPFSSLLTGSGFLIENYEILSPEMKLRHTREIHEAAKLTYDLVNNLLDWSRTQLDRMEFIPSRIDLTRLIRQILKLFESDITRKSLHLNLLIPPRCDMLGDRHMMRFIFRNLVSNAIKFTPRGGHITITVYDRSDQWSITIQDTGVGIPYETIEALTSQKTPLSSNGTEGERGTGMGLILCREFIQMHNGRLSIESQMDQGSLFTLNLPKGQLAPPQKDTTAQEHADA